MQSSKWQCLDSKILQNLVKTITWHCMTNLNIFSLSSVLSLSHDPVSTRFNDKILHRLNSLPICRSKLEKNKSVLPPFIFREQNKTLVTRLLLSWNHQLMYFMMRYTRQKARRPITLQTEYAPIQSMYYFSTISHPNVIYECFTDFHHQHNKMP